MKQLWLVMLVSWSISGAHALAQQAAPEAASNLPAVKRPQARTQPELNDYNAAYAITGGAAMERAAENFAAKYPASELLAYLYSKAMREYQNEANTGKMLAMAEKVLTADPDNSVALVLTATVLADSLSDADRDRDQKIAEIKKNSARALQNVDMGFAPPAGATPEQVAADKETLLSMAHSALGIMELKTGDDAEAERQLKIAVDLNHAQDPYLWYHLALAQDHQEKYPDALVSIQQALRYTGSNPDLTRLAEGELKRLQQQAGQASSGSAPEALPQPSPSRPPR